jgi:hypothetical protein
MFAALRSEGPSQNEPRQYHKAEISDPSRQRSLFYFRIHLKGLVQVNDRKEGEGSDNGTRRN